MKAPPAASASWVFCEEGAFFLDLENAERNAGKNVIAVRDTAAAQVPPARLAASPLMTWTRGSSANCRFEVAGKSRIEFEKEQLRARPHPARDLARMNSFARAVFGDDARLG